MRQAAVLANAWKLDGVELHEALRSKDAFCAFVYVHFVYASATARINQNQLTQPIMVIVHTIASIVCFSMLAPCNAVHWRFALGNFRFFVGVFVSRSLLNKWIRID